jgi:hypothetical protein
MAGWSRVITQEENVNLWRQNLLHFRVVEKTKCDGTTAEVMFAFFSLI